MHALVPSILETTVDGFLNIYNQEIKLPGVERIQVDFGDGIFVPNKMLEVNDIPSLNPAVEWEAHLMISRPENFLDYKICGFNTIIIHFEAFEDKAEIQSAVSEIKSLGLRPALCLKLETPVSIVKEFKDEVKHFQLMSINPGFQGTPFFKETYERVKQLRQLIPDAIIEVDGGIGLANAKMILDSGANLIILGGAITKAPNMLEAYEKISEEVNRK